MMKLRFIKFPRTYMGFPIGEEADTSQASPEEVRKSRGVAMILAIMIVGMMMVFSTDMIINSAVNLQLSTANRDNLKAEYMAKSAMNLAIFLVTVDYGLDLYEFKASGGKKMPADGSFDIWTVLNGLPIGGETIEMMSTMQEAFDLSTVNDGDVLRQLQAFDGQLTVHVEDEGNKINVNQCMIGRGVECIGMLTALMSCPAEKLFLDRKKRVATEVAANIKDWIDLNSTPEEGLSAFTSESEPYDRRSPRVSPKNAPFDSLDELKIIEGWDDDMHKVFAPYLTVFPHQKHSSEKPRVNVNTIGRELLGCLLPDANLNCAQKTAVHFNPLDVEDGTESKSGFNQVQSLLKDTFCETNEKKQKWFTYRSDVYRLRLKGEVGDQVKVIEAVIQRGIPDQKDIQAGIKGSYKFLYWKML